MICSFCGHDDEKTRDYSQELRGVTIKGKKYTAKHLGKLNKRIHAGRMSTLAVPVIYVEEKKDDES